jgi:Uma2 family endonuclease
MSSAEVPEYVSVEEYLATEERALSKREYIDGWVRAMNGATNRHNRIVLNCLVKLANLLEGKPCQPYNSDTKLKIDQAKRKRFYYPDTQVVCQESDPLSVYQEQPVLVIEVLSPSTRRYDLDEKMEAYLSVGSLEGYLVLEQHQPIAILMRRTSEGWARNLIQGIEHSIDLGFIGCDLPMRDIYSGVEFTETCVQEPDPQYEHL